MSLARRGGEPAGESGRAGRRLGDGAVPENH